MVVAVHIITGYAAAGKTHLLNALLRACASSGRTAGVIIHQQAEEFALATSPIATDLAAFSAPVFDFGSGCLCCSPRGEMTRLLTELAARSDLRLDVLFIKTAPLAAPLVLAKSVVRMADTHPAAFELRSIVAVVDPQLAPVHLSPTGDEWQARAQLAACDCVVINVKEPAEERWQEEARQEEAGQEEEGQEGEGQEEAGQEEEGQEEKRQEEEGQEEEAGQEEEGQEEKGQEGEGQEEERRQEEERQEGERRQEEERQQAEAEAVARALALVAQHHASAECVVLRGAADEAAARLLGRDAFRAARDPSWAEAADAPPRLVSASAHDRRVVAACAVEDAPLHERAVRALLASLVRGGGCVRCKAAVRLRRRRAAGEWLYVDAAEEAVRCAYRGAPPAEGGAPPSKLFVLARAGVALGALRQRFSRCAVGDGFELAADVELDFRGGGGGELAAVRSGELPGVVVVRGGEEYFAVEREQRFGVVEVGAPRQVQGEERANPVMMTLLRDPVHGVCLACEAATFRLSDGAEVSGSADEKLQRLLLREVEVVSGGIYVKMNGL
ncbi:hypothetical protein AB1Y20_013059 [Prymnesium parvum]|uniref:CobW/HypB/UreG nucleotide-binding domain-containing protein n=1 Tax=Prymnesium parvum TaxID=97485 RepID=A0AB34IMJ2_PRYPA